ncbi:MAG: 3-deoxy-manno-octulosonate cytidylyltransferase [Thermodesulfobacteriota bacterium]
MPPIRSPEARRPHTRRMNVFAFIPARYSSTRFPGKPLAVIAGEPMIRHAYLCAKACPDITEVYVATDDERILQCVRGFGGKAVLTGEAHPCGTDRVAEAARHLGLDGDPVVVNIQGDQPLFQPALISQMVAPLIGDPELAMSTLKCRISDPREVENPNCVKVVTDARDHALYFSRSPIPYFRDAPAPGVYYKHLGFYAYRLDFLNTFAGLPVGRLEAAEKLEQLRALENGYRIMVVETLFDSVEVDTPADIRRVEAILLRLAAANP